MLMGRATVMAEPWRSPRRRVRVRGFFVESPLWLVRMRASSVCAGSSPGSWGTSSPENAFFRIA